ncbi:MAG: type II secretion system protein [Patescibacteria group bacterium]
MYKVKKQLVGFTLVELLVVIGIIGVLAAVGFMTLGRTTVKARDSIRKAELGQMGKYLGSAGTNISQYIPPEAPTEGDLFELITVLEAKYGTNIFRQKPFDPLFDKSGNVSGFRYMLDAQKDIAIFANLENKEEPVTLPNLSAPTPRGGNGVFQGAGAWEKGWNGTDRYYQVSN